MYEAFFPYFGPIPANAGMVISISLSYKNKKISKWGRKKRKKGTDQMCARI